MKSASCRVVVELPQHTGLDGPLDYATDRPLPPGTLVRVPLGRREVPGIVWDGAAADERDTVGGVGSAAAAPAVAGEAWAPAASGSAAALPAPVDPAAAPRELRPVAAVLTALPPLGSAWRALVDFAAAYYQRTPGELAMSVLPPALRELDDARLGKHVARLQRRWPEPSTDAGGTAAPLLAPEQRAALDGLRRLQTASDSPSAALLYGVTGSGKTEVYLHAVADVLAAGRQALVLVPEINLTPQLEQRFAERFAGRRIVSLHSALTPVQRLASWLAAHLGLADIVLGTRLAVFVPLPRPGLVVVDEEHDPSYKQQEGARYSARDLAVYRGRLEGVPVLLGSATPALETWQRAESGRYARLVLAERIGQGTLPAVRLLDMNGLPKAEGPAPAVSPPLRAALLARLERGEQSLVLLNRRGYAPVLHCGACGWKSACPHCSAWRVFHKIDRSLRCHHCGAATRVPRSCPECGNQDIAPIGRGTERLEEQLAQALPGARVARIDADSTRGKGALEAQLAAVHEGEVDVLVGTQMVAKGHDFRRITLVAVVNPDAALFASDFRAPERLFALLMQAAGRAGRDAAMAGASELWVQTWHPRHPLYAALAAHDYAAFAASQLQERRRAGLPPYTHLALLRADARTQDAALAWLEAAAAAAGGAPDGITLYPPVPLTVQRVANVERAQMLVEAVARPRLQRFLADWTPALHGLRPAHKGLLRWAIDVDPLAI